jgi:hypothetical protein
MSAENEIFQQWRNGGNESWRLMANLAKYQRSIRLQWQYENQCNVNGLNINNGVMA